MKPVAQLIDSDVNGDCFRACVASILELDPHLLPNVTEPEYKDRYHVGVMNDALARLGIPLVLESFSGGQAFFDGIPWMIWNVPSPRYEGKGHAIVVQSLDEPAEDAIHSHWRVAWDPSPWRDTNIEHRRECYAKPYGSYLFVARDPAAFVPRVGYATVGSATETRP